MALVEDLVPGAGVGGVTSKHFVGTRGGPQTPTPPPLHRALIWGPER